MRPDRVGLLKTFAEAPRTLQDTPRTLSLHENLMVAHFRGGVIASLAVLLLTVPVSAAEPTGTWSTEGGKARVRIAKCADALCGTIVSLAEPNDPATGKPKTDRHNADASKRNRPVIGISIVLGMKPSGAPDKWSGQVYNAEDGKTYTGSLTMQGANTLRLEGCAMAVFCKSQTWTRVN